MALLSGARNGRHSHLAQQVFDRMKKNFPQSKDVLTSGLILLANVYGSIGDMNRASDLRIQLQNSGFKKEAGISLTVVNGEIYVSLDFNA